MTYDGILLGTGHNALVLRAYLSRAGFDILCLDRREVAGGGLATEEFPAGSGYFHNPHSFYHRALDKMLWYQELGLAGLGATYHEPEHNVAMALRDGRTLSWWTDFEKTAASVATFNRGDADTFRKWRDRFLPIVQNLLIPEAQSPPLPPEERKQRLSQTPDGQLLLETSALSPLEFVQREFQDPAVQAGLLFFNGLREVDLRCKGFGHHIPALLAGPGMAQLCRGGSAKLAEALVQAGDGDLRLGVELEEILVEGGRAVGVRTSDGETYRAQHFVASGLNPQQTFLDLLPEDAVPSEWRNKAQNFQYNRIAPLFGTYLNLDEPPKYKNPGLDDAFMVILGLDHVDQFHDIVRHHETGTFPLHVMWGSCPTQFDPTQAPTGKHTAFMCEKLPYRPDWDDLGKRHSEAMLQTWSTYAPNLPTSITHSFWRSPLDTERTLPNMHHGDLLVGAFTGGQTGYHRPFPGAGHYRGHLDGLYLCGSSCHPGGNITGLPGYNCAKVLSVDLGLDISPSKI